MDKLTSILAAVECPACGIVLDKAIAIARRFDAQVHLLVTDATLLPGLLARCGELRYERVVMCSVPPGEETLQKAIQRCALERQPDLVIKAAAHAHPLRRWTIDPNDRQLAHECPVPLLLVGREPWRSTLRIAACVDVSDPDSTAFARATLQAAGFLAIGCVGFLDVLYTEREQHDDRLRMERAVKVSQLAREFYMSGDSLQVLSGAPEKVLPPLLESRRYDILAIGGVTHHDGLRSWTDALSSRLVDATPGDVLLVRPPESDAGVRAARQSSVREQRAHLA